MRLGLCLGLATALAALPACGDDEAQGPIDAAGAGDPAPAEPDAAIADAEGPAPDGFIPPDAPLDDSGVAYLPDLILVDSQMQTAPIIEWRNFGAGDPAIEEGCVVGPGQRRILKFDTVTGNIGNLDLWLGVPSASNPAFVWSPAHGHYHVAGFAEYRLTDGSGTVITGHKQAFCLMDSLQIAGEAGEGKYYCDNQGITAGWADVYGRYLDCQWIDITTVAPGDYTLEIEVNPEGRFQESDSTNDVWTRAVTIPAP